MTKGRQPASGVGLGYNQGLFLALSIVVIIIIALTVPDTMTALALIGLIVGLYYAWRATYGGAGRGKRDEYSDGEGKPAANRLLDRGFDGDMLFDETPEAAASGGGFCPDAGKAESETAGGGAGIKEGWSTLPGPEPPFPVSGLSGPPSPADWDSYPGAIHLDNYQSDAEYGARDRTAGDNAYAAEGNEFNLSREDAPGAAPVCIDDEANDAEMDGDELMAVQGTNRNDATRVWAGVYNRRRDLDQYLREEVDEQENRPWWGRSEL